MNDFAMRLPLWYELVRLVQLQSHKIDVLRCRPLWPMSPGNTFLAVWQTLRRLPLVSHDRHGPFYCLINKVNDNQSWELDTEREWK